MFYVDGHEDALVGTGVMFGRQEVAVYSSRKIIEKLMERDGMTEEEAEEFFDFNILGSYNGPGMPLFIR
tara:strand:+ start:1326 stop:1532 length:207 start_codon:yes stop_codon:yes gene_type:complete